MTPIYALAGDTFFTRSSSVLGRLIRWAETERGEEPAWTNHVGVVIADGWIGGGLEPQAEVIEALWKTRRGPLRTNGVEVRVFRPVPEYTYDELQRFFVEAETYVGDTYGWWKLLGFLAKRAWGLNIPLLYTKRDRPICSFLAALVNTAARPNRVGEAFGMPPQSADPDEMLDFCLTHPNLWEEIV